MEKGQVQIKFDDDIWDITHMCTEMNQFIRNGFPKILSQVELGDIKIHLSKKK